MPEDGFEVEAPCSEDAAEEAAKRDYNEHDGWERKDNFQTIELEDEAGRRWRFIVEREFVETFHATEERKPLKLNLGSGPDYRPGFVNVDAGPFKKDRDWDVFARLPLADGEAEEIVAIDVLEHAPWPRTEAILREWVRVLHWGGKLTLQVPNLRFLCREYLEGRLTAFEASRWIYGGQGDGGHGLGPAHAHLNAHGAGFDHQRLQDLCRACGLEVGWLQDCGSNLVLEATKQ